MPDPQSTIVGFPMILTERIRQMEETEFVLDFIERSMTYREPFIPIWDEVQDNYMVVPFGGSPIDAIGALLGLRTTGVLRKVTDSVSRLKDPETHQVIETLTSQALGLLLGAANYIQAIPIGIDDPEKARLISRLLQAVFDQPGMFRTHYELFKEAFLYGTAIIEIGWETRERMQAVQKPLIDPLTGAYQGHAVEQDSIIYRDRVLMRRVGLRDFFPDPSGTRIHEDMQGVAKRFRISKWQLRALRDAGVYDREPVNRLFQMLSNNVRAPQRYGDNPFPRLADIMPPNKYGLSTGFEFWGEVPFDRPGGRNRVITLVNGQWVRGRPNAFLDGDIPMKEIVVNPVGGRFYGLGPAEVIRFLQDSTDNFLMLFTDAGDLAVRSPLLVGQAFGGDPERLRMRRTNDAIPCRNPEAVKPVPMDMGPVDFAAREMARRIMRMREASGATNPLQAIPADQEKTATETNELIRLATQRVQTGVQLIERDDYPWIGRTVHSRIRQFAEADIVTTLAGDKFSVSLDQIDIDADVRFVGSQQGGTPYQITAGMTAAIDTLAQVPPWMLQAFPDLFVRLFRDGLRIPDAERIVDEAVKMASIQSAQEAAGAAGKSGRSGSAPANKGTAQAGPGTSETPAEMQGGGLS